MRVLIICCLLVLSGCSDGTAPTYKINGANVHKLCIDGVLYYSIRSSKAVAYNTDSTVKTCTTL